LGWQGGGGCSALAPLIPKNNGNVNANAGQIQADRTPFIACLCMMSPFDSVVDWGSLAIRAMGSVPESSRTMTRPLAVLFRTRFLQSACQRVMKMLILRANSRQNCALAVHGWPSKISVIGPVGICET